MLINLLTRLLAHQKFSKLHHKDTLQSVGSLLPFPSNILLFLIPSCAAQNIRKGVLSLSQLVFFPCIFLSFPFILLLAMVTGGQSHTTAPDLL